MCFRGLGRQQQPQQGQLAIDFGFTGSQCIGYHSQVRETTRQRCVFFASNTQIKVGKFLENFTI